MRRVGEELPALGRGKSLPLDYSCLDHSATAPPWLGHPGSAEKSVGGAGGTTARRG